MGIKEAVEERSISIEEWLILKSLDTNSEREQYLKSIDMEDTPNEKLSEKARFIANKIKLNNGVPRKWK